MFIRVLVTKDFFSLESVEEDETLNLNIDVNCKLGFIIDRDSPFIEELCRFFPDNTHNVIIVREFMNKRLNSLYYEYLNKGDVYFMNENKAKIYLLDKSIGE